MVALRYTAWQLANSTEPDAGTALKQPAGLPVVVSINSTPLNTDGQTITLDPAKAVELAVLTDRPANSLYQWNIYEVVPDAAMTAADYKIVYVANAGTSTVKIPHDAFTAGKVYTIRGHAFAGAFPGVAMGDLQMRELPYSIGFLDSGVFTVQSP